ncbi:hypothetical protein OROGR_002374 [Orobanche gracilis]
MGCSASKEDDLPLVVRCRERRELVRAAANHRHALAAAHVSNFRSLREVGDALRRFVDEDLVTTVSSSFSSFSSPSLTLPPASKKHNRGGDSPSHLHLHDGDIGGEDESHLHLSDSSSEAEDDSDEDHHHHSFGNDAHQHPNQNQQSNRLPYAPARAVSGSVGPAGGAAVQPWFFTGNSNVYYMKKSAPSSKTVVQDPPAYGYSDSYWTSPAGYGGIYGYFPMGNGREGGKGKPEREREREREAPPPPSPKASASAFFDPFYAVDSGYAGYYSGGGYGYGSNYSSPDSIEVREREGIPDLEEETESEAYKEALDGGKMSSAGSSPRSRAILVARRSNEAVHRIEGSSRSIPPQRSEHSSKLHSKSKGSSSSRSASLHKIDSSSNSVPSWSSEESEKPSVPPPHNDGNHSKHYSEDSVKPTMSTPHGEGTSWVDGETGSISLTDDKSSSDHIVVKSVDEGSGKKEGVTFEVEETSKQDGDSSKLSSVALSSPRGTRDLRDVVAEIRDDFDTASSYGKEVAMMLEVGKLPYQPSMLKVTMSRLMHLIDLSTSLWDSPSKQSAKLAFSTMKMAKSYFDDVGNDVNVKASNLSSTLDKLYAWEKKLYKDVKDEEKIRVMYEKQHKRLKTLDGSED